MAKYSHWLLAIAVAQIGYAWVSVEVDASKQVVSKIFFSIRVFLFGFSVFHGPAVKAD